MSTAATFCSIGIPLEILCDAQKSDLVISTVHHHLSRSHEKSTNAQCWKQPLPCYAKLWPQLIITGDIVCRRYSPEPNSELITVPVLPRTLQQEALHNAHNTPSSGHQGQDKTLQRLCFDAYWVGMASDVTIHCQKCTTCQQAKLLTPPKVPLVSVPVGRQWEMLTVDVLEG